VELLGGRRLLKTNDGLALYAIPTSAGWVTFVRNARSGRSIPKLEEHVGWLWEYDGRSTYFYGVVDDEVRSMRGLPSGMSGTVTDNGFAFVGDGRIAIDSVEVELADGHTERVPIQR
jgi:hypothetical protein